MMLATPQSLANISGMVGPASDDYSLLVTELVASLRV